MKYYCKVYKVQGEVLVAACDEELRGKVFEDDNLVLNVKKDFYGHQLLDKEKITPTLKGATIANLVGEGIVTHAMELGLVDPNTIIKINGVPHIQIVRM